MKSPLDLTQFDVITKVGQGGFGEVFKVKKKDTENIYAAKVALKSLEEVSKDTLRNLSREINIISKLNHPSIVKFIGYSPVNFKNKPKPVIITEFLSNGSLGDILNLERKGLCDVGWNDTRKIINIYGIAAAMSYLHSHDIIHRDLKPDNILMDEYLLPKLTDFGLSKMKHSHNESMTQQSTATLKGTPIYVAPEIWESYEYTKAGDVYAFAFIVFEIMTLEEPYKNCDYFGLMTKVINGIRPEILGVPESYKNLIEKCWDQNPSNRPTFDEIVDDLKNNDEYITDLVESDDYNDYIEYIEKCKISFNSKSKINITQFLNHETKTFQKIAIDQNLIKKVKDDEENDDEDENDDDYESNNSSSNEESTKKEDNKLYIQMKKKELPFPLPPDDDPSVLVYRELLYKKIFTSPKEDIPIILYTYAALSDYGTIYPKNDKEAVIFFKIAADLGHVDSMWHYAIHLNQGSGVPQNIKESDRYFEMAIEKGSLEAMFTYASYLEKRNDPKCKKKAIQLYTEAANKGDKHSMTNLGYIFLRGEGVKRDPKKALKYYKMAAKKGETLAMKNIGVMYQKGDGVDVNLEKAMNYYKLASNNGDSDCTNCIGLMYKEGQGIKQNKEKAIKYFKMAIEKGNTDAMVNLGKMLLETKEPDQINEAIKIFKNAAELNNTKAMFNLSIIFNQGIGKSVNKEKSIEYLHKAIDLGEVLAMRALAIRYKEGDGVPIDLEKSFNLLKTAADTGSTEDMLLLGLDYQNGSGTEKNPKEAIKYFKKGTELGNINCMTAYAEALYLGLGTEINETKAMKYYLEAASKGNAIAMGRVGSIMLDNDKNSERGFQFLRMAVTLGDVFAMDRLAYNLQNSEGRTQEELDESYKYAKMAYNAGMTSSISRICKLLNNEKINEENIQEAISLVKKAADSGDTFAMSTYAVFLSKFSKPTPEIINETVHYTKMAAENGEFTAFVPYGLFLRSGVGVERNVEEAKRYFKMAADQGSEDGLKYYNTIENDDPNLENIQNMLGIITTVQDNLSDPIAGLAGLKNLADRGTVSAMIAYATIIEKGELCVPDYNESTRYYKMAADNGSPDGKYYYGVNLYLGRGCKCNFKKACSYFKMALDEGNVYALNAYGAMLDRGTGIPKNKSEACKYYKLAADQNLAQGKNNYGVMLYNGEGTMRNIKLAGRYFKEAADDNERTAMVNYGYMLEKGICMKVNRRESSRYYYMGVGYNDSNAMKSYASLLDRKGTYTDRNEAGRYFQLAADHNNIIKTINYLATNFTRYIIPVEYNYNYNSLQRKSSRNNNNNNDDDSLSSSLSDDENSIPYPNNTLDRNIKIDRNIDNGNEKKNKCTKKAICCYCFWSFIIMLVIACVIAFCIVYFDV